MKTRAVKILLTILWYCAATAVMLWYAVRYLLPSADAVDAADLPSILSFARVAVGFIAAAAAFFLCHFVARLWWRNSAVLQRGNVRQVTAPGTPSASVSAFPAPITILVGGFVLLFGIADMAGFALAWSLPASENRTMLLTTLAAGLGSFVATTLGYLLHASEKRDFDTAYSAWYIGRPVIGIILGLMFYFVIRGGLLMVATQGSDVELSDVAMAAVGSLVGLFSKNAFEKLREVFNTLFQTKDGMSEEILASLPPDLREKLGPYLRPTAAPTEPRKQTEPGKKEPSSPKGGGS